MISNEDKIKNSIPGREKQKELPGYCTISDPHKAWVRGYWHQRQDGGWYWIGGHWDRV